MVEDVSADRIEKNVDDKSGKCPNIIRGGGKLSAESGTKMIIDAVLQDKMTCTLPFKIEGGATFSKNQDFIEKCLGRKLEAPKPPETAAETPKPKKRSKKDAAKVAKAIEDGKVTAQEKREIDDIVSRYVDEV